MRTCLWDVGAPPSGLWFGVGLSPSPSRMPFPFSICFFLLHAIARSGPLCRAQSRPALSWGHVHVRISTCGDADVGCGCLLLWFGVGLSPSRMNAFFVWFFFCVPSQHLVRCAVHSAAPSRPGDACTCTYARARAAKIRDVSGRDRDDVSRSSLRSQLGGTGRSVPAVLRPRRTCVFSTPATRLGVGTCHCERYQSGTGCTNCLYARARAEMRDVSGRDRDDASRSSLRSQLGGTGSVPAVRPRRICVFSTPTRLGLGTCHCEKYQSGSGCTNCLYARARAEMRAVSGRHRDGASRSSLRSQLGGTVSGVCCTSTSRLCVFDTNSFGMGHLSL